MLVLAVAQALAVELVLAPPDSSRRILVVELVLAVALVLAVELVLAELVELVLAVARLLLRSRLGEGSCSRRAWL